MNGMMVYIGLDAYNLHFYIKLSKSSSRDA